MIGGCDYLPKFNGYLHDTVLSIFLDNKTINQSLYCMQYYQNIGELFGINLSREVYVQFIQMFYTPKRVKNKNLTFDQFRHLSIYDTTTDKLKHHKCWMPPLSVLLRVANGVQCLIDYMLTVGHHDMPCPKVLNTGYTV